MNLSRLLRFVAGAAALAAAAAITLTAASFAIYALLRPSLGPAGAAGVVCGLFALTTLVLGLVLARRPSAGRRPQEDEGLAARAMVLARQRPLLAAGVGVAGLLVLLRNPALISALVSAALAGRASKPGR